MHPYINKTGILRILDRTVRPHAWVPTVGVVAFVGQESEEVEGGAVTYPAVTIRLPDGSHKTGHIDCFTLDPDQH